MIGKPIKIINYKNMSLIINKQGNNSVYHIMALFTVIIWGTTFISTKVLIKQGLSPEDILFYRFLIAYICIWTICPRKLFANNLKDELLFIAIGLCGGSLYFIAENRALGITLASNVSLIVCTASIFTAILSHLFIKGERFKKNLISGSFIALAGVAFVVFNGSFILKINPAGDILTITAALMWAFYSIILKRLDKKYSTLLITRKVFFYGIITLLPTFLISPLTTDTHILFQPTVLGNFIFLGVVASMLCYILWNMSIKHLGAVRTTNYVYIVPLVTLITSSIILNETITPFAIAGALLILSGVYIAEKGFPWFKKIAS
jgi:drug/metabolite transporter (DMT)-like permease